MHLFARDWGVFDVYMLFDLTKNIKPTTISIESALPMLDCKIWDGVVDGIGYMSFAPNDLLDWKSVHSIDHWIRIMEADLSYPLLALDQFSVDSKLLNPDPISEVMSTILGRYDIIDGMHRLAKAKVLKLETVDIKVVPWDIIMQSKIIDKSIWNQGISAGLIKSDMSGYYHI
jgi:hypothetical protein